jgi:hypothetical protein
MEDDQSAAYSDDFESVEDQADPSCAAQNADDEDFVPEDTHRLRISLEIHSIREVTFPELLYVKYNYPLLGFNKTNPIAAMKNMELHFEGNFKAHEFAMTKSELYPSLTSNSVLFEIVKTDKFEKDVVIGTAELGLDGLLRAPLKKTAESVLRMYDIWIPVNAPDGTRLGELRVITCLEDLGPESGALATTTLAPQSAAAQDLEAWKRIEETRWMNSLKEKEQIYLSEKSIGW